MTTKSDAPAVDDLIQTMAVAILLKCRYQKARDRMLSGDFGTPQSNEDGRMVVSRAAVLSYLAAHAKESV